MSNEQPKETQECVIGDAAEAALTYCPRWLKLTQPGPTNPFSDRDRGCDPNMTSDNPTGCTLGSGWWVLKDCRCTETRESTLGGSPRLYCHAWKCDELYVDQQADNSERSTDACFKAQPRSEAMEGTHTCSPPR